MFAVYQVQLRPMETVGLGYDPRSTYAELFWLPLLGPASLLLLRRAAYLFDDHPAGFDFDLDILAACLGLRGGAARNGTLTRTFQRLRRFNFADTTYVDDGVVEVARTLYALTPRGIEHLPPVLKADLISRTWPRH